MPFIHGQPRPKGAGRKKGSGNRATVAAILTQNDCDPIEEMIELARHADTRIETKARIYAELASYRWPKLRAIEHSGPGGGAIPIDTSAAEILTSRIAGVAARIGTSQDISRVD